VNNLINISFIFGEKLRKNIRRFSRDVKNIKGGTATKLQYLILALRKCKE